MGLATESCVCCKPANTANIADIIKIATTCFLHMLFEIDVFIKRYT